MSVAAAEHAVDRRCTTTGELELSIGGLRPEREVLERPCLRRAPRLGAPAGGRHVVPGAGADVDHRVLELERRVVAGGDEIAVHQVDERGVAARGPQAHRQAAGAERAGVDGVELESGAGVDRHVAGEDDVAVERHRRAADVVVRAADPVVAGERLRRRVAVPAVHDRVPGWRRRRAVRGDLAGEAVHVRREAECARRDGQRVVREVGRLAVVGVVDDLARDPLDELDRLRCDAAAADVIRVARRHRTRRRGRRQREQVDLSLHRSGGGLRPELGAGAGADRRRLSVAGRAVGVDRDRAGGGCRADEDLGAGALHRDARASGGVEHDEVGHAEELTAGKVPGHRARRRQEGVGSSHASEQRRVLAPHRHPDAFARVVSVARAGTPQQVVACPDRVAERHGVRSGAVGGVIRRRRRPVAARRERRLRAVGQAR